MQLFRFRKRRKTEIDPDEILIDSSNLCRFDTAQFEGRLETPISKLSLYAIASVLFIIVMIFSIQAWKLQIVHGESYLARSDKNILRPIPVFAGRGVVFDRNNVPLIWNSPSKTFLAAEGTSTVSTDDAVAYREYATSTGLSHILGYVQYPSKDSNGFYYKEDFEGVDGVERYFDGELQGKNGSRLVEVDAMGVVISESVIKPPQQGNNLILSIDSRVQSSLYNNLRDIADRVGFTGGAGVIMNTQTGEVIAVTSFPEYDSQVISDRKDTDTIKKMLSDKSLPFLNRAVDGLYTPGSIVKPYIAIGALTEKTIAPDTVIMTTGSISIPNPYDKEKSTVFKDWKNHGPLDMRHALAVSSDVYFYTIGGGYKDQKGLGILTIDKYLRMFGLGAPAGSSFLQGKAGTIPTPEWKKKTFDEDWYLGNTYHTSIGQYGFQVTPIQMARAVAAIANGGTMLTPTIIKDYMLPIESTISDIPDRNFAIVREGMRMSVTEGTSKLLDLPFVHLAVKSGTAELGESRQKVNSWITGFWPYENPKYAFAVMLEKGSVHNLIGAAAAMKQELEWMNIYTPEYFD